MKAALATAAVILLATARPARAEYGLPWYRGFYTRIGVRESIGAQEPFHSWAAFAFGIGYRYQRRCWGIDASALNVQYDPEEGMHTAGRIVGYANMAGLTRVDAWIGGGLSYGWIKGTVDQAIPKRRGEGWQLEVVAGSELSRRLRARTFIQGTLTAPLYQLRDTMLYARDTTIYVYAVEFAVGVRF